MSSLSRWWRGLWGGHGVSVDHPQAPTRPPEEPDRGGGAASETGSGEDVGRDRAAGPAISTGLWASGPGQTEGAPSATTQCEAQGTRDPDSTEGRGFDPYEGDVLRSDRLWYARPTGDDEAVLIIGFDLGTSTSKIIVHAPYMAGGIRFLAEREKCGASVGPAWLWPSSFFVGDDGICALTGDGSAETRQGIKLDLMEAAVLGGDSAEDWRGSGAAVTAYLALVLRTVRSQLLMSHADAFRGYGTVRWSVNFGVPSGLREESRDQDSRRERLFERAVTGGWQLSLLDEPIRLEDAENAFVRPDVAGVEIGVFPEVIAGVLGYDRSDSRRDGLHLAVDVGAATVDVCLFELPVAANGTWPLLEARVEQLGVVELHRRRVAEVADVDAGAVEKLERSYDPLNGMAGDPGILGSAPGFDAIDAVDRQVRREIGDLVGGFVQDGKTRRDPNAAVYGSGGAIPTLVMGGGSRAEFYLRALREAGDRFAEKLGERHRGLDIVGAPVPDDVNLQSDGMGYRLAVAVGLSEEKLNLPAYWRPGEVEDVVRPPPKRRVRPSVDKDQV